MINHVIISILAVILGQATSHLTKALYSIVECEDELKKLPQALKSKFKIDYIYSGIFLVVFNILVHFMGLTFTNYIYALSISLLATVFIIDYKKQLIPDTVQILLALLGIINLIANYSNWFDYLCGAVVGAGTFCLLGVLAKIIYKKEGMGMGDVKLMGALGLIFGLKGIAAISLVSFFIGAIISIILIILKRQSMDGYIPFGPFIVIGAVLVIVLGADTYINMFIELCTWLGDSISRLVF